MPEKLKPVVEAPEDAQEDVQEDVQIMSTSQHADLAKSAKLYAEGKKKRAEAEELIVRALGKEPTLPQVTHAKAYFGQVLKKQKIKNLNSSIINEVNKLFKTVMEFNQIPYPQAQTQSAQKARASREANARKEADRLRKKGLLDKPIAELKKLKKTAFNTASKAEGAEEELAEAEIKDLKSAIKIAESKQKEGTKEAVKVIKVDLRAYITEENRLHKLEKMREALKKIASED